MIKTTKPFFPFTPRPIIKSNFTLHYEEAFSKQWKTFDAKFTWKDTPDDFVEWYDTYKETLRLATSKGTFLSEIESADAEKIVENKEHFTAEKSILHKEIWEPVDTTQTLFTDVLDDPDKPTGELQCSISYINTNNFEAEKSGPIRLSLEKGFLHKMYPRLYAMALLNDGTTHKIPNEPYTPIAENLTISYTAEEYIEVKSQSLQIDEDNQVSTENSVNAFQTKRIQLFHEHPFGLAEEHNYLKINRYQKGIRSAYDGEAFETHLVPKYCQGGDLFIGLENAETEQTVSLLIQVLEGSENPLVDSFDDLVI